MLFGWDFRAGNSNIQRSSIPSRSERPNSNLLLMPYLMFLTTYFSFGFIKVDFRNPKWQMPHLESSSHRCTIDFTILHFLFFSRCLYQWPALVGMRPLTGLATWPSRAHAIVLVGGVYLVATTPALDLVTRSKMLPVKSTPEPIVENVRLDVKSQGSLL